MVVDSPPGMISASTSSSSRGRRTVAPRAPACSTAYRCSRTSPWTARTPMVGLEGFVTAGMLRGRPPRLVTVPLPDARIRARTPDDLPALAEVLAAQQPYSGYPQRWTLPFPAEDFIRRDGEDAAWVADLDAEVVGH